MVWASIVLFVACGVALIIWRKEAAYLQGMTFGGTVAPGGFVGLCRERDAR
jgi:hypothetical protein